MPKTRQPESQLTAADIDEAFHRTMTRSNELSQRRSRRVAALSGLAVVALLLGGYGILKSLDDGGEGWVTVAALAEGDTPAAQLCSHVLGADGPVSA